MLVKTFNIILVSMLSMLFFIIIQKPYELDKMNYKLDFKSLEANDIIGYEIDTKLKTLAYAKQYYKIGNQDNLLDFEVKSLDKELSALKATKENDEIILENKVIFKDKEINLESEYVKYLKNQQILSSDTKTKATYNGSLINANSFKYDLKTQKLVLEEVNLCIEK